MAGATPEEWDERYRRAGDDPGQPEPALVEALGKLPPGPAVDLAAGTGRHSLWLAARGWAVTAVDWSPAGVAVGRAAAARRGLSVTWAVADAREWGPGPAATPVDLVLAARVRLPDPVLRRAAGWLAPGGRLVVLGHAVPRPGETATGPRDPALRHDEASMRAVAAGLEVLRLDRLHRPTPDGPSPDLLLVARRPAAGGGAAAPRPPTT